MFYLKNLLGSELNQEIYNKKLFIIIIVFKKWRAELVLVYILIIICLDH